MYIINPIDLPTPNRNIYNLIIEKCNGNIAEFARFMGFDNSTKINRLFVRDKRNNKYPMPSTELLIAIATHYPISVDDLLFSDNNAVKTQENAVKSVNNINIVKGNGNNTSINN